MANSNQDKDIEQFESKNNNPEPPKIQSILDSIQIPDIDFDSPEAIGEGIDTLSIFILICRHELLKRSMTGKKLSDDDLYRIEQATKQLAAMEKTYQTLIRTGRIPDPKKQRVAEAEAQSSKNFMDKIKKMRSTVGSIVRDMKTE
jgi:hypothetical protein